MRKYLSVFGLAGRSSFWKGLAVILISAVLAGLLLCITPGSVTETYIDKDGVEKTYEEVSPMSVLPGKSMAAIPVGVGMCALCAILAGIGWGRGAESGYTMRRLRVKKNTACLLWTMYNFMMLALFWVVTALTLFFVMVMRIKGASAAGEFEPLAMILTCYGAPLLHHLLPVGDAYAWCGNILGILACAAGCADVAHKKWNGQPGGIALAIAMVLTAGGCFLKLQYAGTQGLLIAGETLLVGIVVFSWRGGDVDEETDLAAG